MSVMVDWEIKEAIDNGWLKVTPFEEKLINPASLDFRLGRFWTKVIMNDKDYQAVNPLDPKSFINETFEAASYIMPAKSTILVSTLETFDLAGNYVEGSFNNFGIAAEVKGKSSLARCFLGNSYQAGWIDCGFVSSITLEISNESSYPVLLTEGMKIGQLVLYKTLMPNKDYKHTGRYNNQAKGAGSLGI